MASCGSVVATSVATGAKSDTAISPMAEVAVTVVSEPPGAISCRIVLRSLLGSDRRGPAANANAIPIAGRSRAILSCSSFPFDPVQPQEILRSDLHGHALAETVREPQVQRREIE